jgi:predicted nucleotidyltransferase
LNVLEALSLIGFGDEDPRAQTLRSTCRESLKRRNELGRDVQNIFKAFDGVDVLACGSLARQEYGEASDIDYLVVVSDTPSSLADLREAGHELQQLIDGQGQKPGTSGVFGQTVGAFDLIEQVGLQEDTNHSHTRRMEILLESVSLTAPEARPTILDSIVDRYTTHSIETSKAPRFLINDVLRYWRTLAVDFQAKRDGTHGHQKMILRYLKLIITRKMLFAGSVLPLVLFEPKGSYVAELAGVFGDPPLSRFIKSVAELRDDSMTAEAMRVCEILDDFLAATDTTEKRARFDQIEWSQRTNDQQYCELKKSADELHASLARIFTSDQVIQKTREYMLF